MIARIAANKRAVTRQFSSVMAYYNGNFQMNTKNQRATSTEFESLIVTWKYEDAFLR